MIRTSRHSLSVLALAAALAAGACADADAPTAAPRAGAGPALSSGAAGRHVVEFSGGVPSSFAGLVAALGGSVETTYGSVGIAVVTGLSDAAAGQLAASSGVSRVQPDIEIQGIQPIDVGVMAADVTPASPGAPQTAFFYPRQWNMRAIGANQAWAAGKLGSAGVTVAILDTGIDYTHPDLAGLVDLSRSASFVPSDDAIVAALFPGKHPVTDLQYHGTHVAATVASNAQLAAGVTSRTTLIGVKVLNRNGSGSFSGILAGIMHAADAGADVINMSLGGLFNRSDSDGFLGTINRTINYAQRNGTLVVVAAGNSGIDLDHAGNLYASFCNAPNVVCVSATGPTASAGTNGPWANVDAVAAYSNFGRSSISVAAPGGNSGAGVAAACSRTSLVFPICASGTFVLTASGTSMASPHVAGLAALLVAEIGHDRPSQVRARLQQSADDLGQPGTDPRYGKGRISVTNALGL